VIGSAEHSLAKGRFSVSETERVEGRRLPRKAQARATKGKQQAADQTGVKGGNEKIARRAGGNSLSLEKKNSMEKEEIAPKKANVSRKLSARHQSLKVNFLDRSRRYDLGAQGGGEREEQARKKGKSDRLMVADAGKKGNRKSRTQKFN